MYLLRNFLVFCLVAAGISSNAQVIINDGNAEERKVTPFTGIRVSGGIAVQLSQGSDYALAVSASDPKYVNNIKTEIIDGILTISYSGSNLRMNENRNLRAYIAFKNLESLQVSGACDLIINEALKGDKMKFTFSGASSLKGTVNIESLSLNMSGASTLKIDGKVGKLDAESSGASDIKNYNLVAESAQIRLSGASDMRLTVKDKLIVNASGASSLIYQGNPRDRNINTSGASSVSQRN